MEEKDSTEQKIFEAAHVEFTQRGFDGAKMQDIADRAGINKALLHYYYRSKDKLYQMVARAVMSKNIPTLRKVLESDLPLVEKLPLFIDKYIGVISKNHYLPLFLISEMNKHPDRFFDEVLPKDFPKPTVLIRQVKEEVEKGNIRPIDPRHLVVNVMSLCIFPFIGKPMIRMVLSMDSKEWDLFIADRKKEVTAFVMNALKP